MTKLNSMVKLNYKFTIYDKMQEPTKDELSNYKHCISQHNNFPRAPQQTMETSKCINTMPT